MKWKWTTNRIIVLATTIFSVPFIWVGSWLWLRAETDPGGWRFESYWFGDHILCFGCPVSWGVLWLHLKLFGGVGPAQFWWAIPLFAILFIAQWSFWLCLLVWCGGKLIGRGRSESNQQVQPIAGKPGSG